MSPGEYGPSSHSATSEQTSDQNREGEGRIGCPSNSRTWGIHNNDKVLDSI